MHIDSYQFGEIVIDGDSFCSDVIIFGGCVRPNWWRKQGHSLAVEDLRIIIDARPAVLIIGTGASGMIKVPAETRKALLEYGILLQVLDTAGAVKRFNELSQSGTDVAAALHLTC